MRIEGAVVELQPIVRSNTPGETEMRVGNAEVNRHDYLLTIIIPHEVVRHISA